MNSLTANDNLEIIGGTLNFGAVSTINAGATLPLSAGSLGGAGTLAINGNFAWSGGTVSVAEG